MKQILKHTFGGFGKSLQTILQYNIAAIVAVFVTRLYSLSLNMETTVLFLVVFSLVVGLIEHLNRKATAKLYECPTEGCSEVFEVYDLSDYREYEHHIWECYEVVPGKSKEDSHS